MLPGKFSKSVEPMNLCYGLLFRLLSNNNARNESLRLRIDCSRTWNKLRKRHEILHTAQNLLGEIQSVWTILRENTMIPFDSCSLAEGKTPSVEAAESAYQRYSRPSKWLPKSSAHQRSPWLDGYQEKPAQPFWHGHTSTRQALFSGVRKLIEM